MGKRMAKRWTPGFWQVITVGRFRYQDVASLIGLSASALRAWRSSSGMSEKGREDVQHVLGLSPREIDHVMDPTVAASHASRWRQIMRSNKLFKETQQSRHMWTVGLRQIRRAGNCTIDMLARICAVSGEAMRKYVSGCKVRASKASNMGKICDALGISYDEVNDGLDADRLAEVIESIGPQLEQARRDLRHQNRWAESYHRHLSAEVRKLRERTRQKVAEEMQGRDPDASHPVDRSKWQWRHCMQCLRRYQVGSMTTCADCILERF